MRDIVSDLHKDARGTRPSQDWMAWFDSFSEDKQKEIVDQLAAEVEDSIMEDTIRQAKAQGKLMFTIDKLAKDYNVPNGRALRWLIDAEGIEINDDQDIEHFLWLNDVPFEAFSYFKELYKEE